MDPALRRTIANGDYRVDPDAVAEAMIARMSVVLEAQKATDRSAAEPEQDAPVPIDDSA
jgi:Anti-sigma-28 factor, FlgM